MGSTTPLFCNLKILSQVRQNDRVSSRRDVLDISRTSVMESCRRWWYGESRAHNISAIAKVLEMAFHNVQLYIEKTEPTPQDCQTINRLDRELRGARAGIANLLETYDRDSVAKAQILCMLENIDQWLQALSVHVTIA